MSVLTEKEGHVFKKIRNRREWFLAINVPGCSYNVLKALADKGCLEMSIRMGNFSKGGKHIIPCIRKC